MDRVKKFIVHYGSQMLVTMFMIACLSSVS